MIALRARHTAHRIVSQIIHAPTQALDEVKAAPPPLKAIDAEPQLIEYQAPHQRRWFSVNQILLLTLIWMVPLAIAVICILALLFPSVFGF